jgi:hypothetical protein
MMTFGGRRSGQRHPPEPKNDTENICKVWTWKMKNKWFCIAMLCFGIFHLLSFIAVAGEAVSYESEFDFDKVRELELYKTSKTGKTFVQVFLSPWKTSSDDQEGFLVHVMDTSERKQAEEEL